MATSLDSQVDISLLSEHDLDLTSSLACSMEDLPSGHSSLGTSHTNSHVHTPTLAHTHTHTHTSSTSASLPSESRFRTSKPRSRRNSTRRHRHNTMDNDAMSKDILGDEMRHEHSDEEGAEIAISSNGAAITPFLAKHIPNTYNPMNQQGHEDEARPLTSSNTKYCNRHRPDRKCRRQADGPSMDQLQNEISSLSHGDRSAISVCLIPYPSRVALY